MEPWLVSILPYFSSLRRILKYNALSKTAVDFASCRLWLTALMRRNGCYMMLGPVLYDVLLFAYLLPVEQQMSFLSKSSHSPVLDTESYL